MSNESRYIRRWDNLGLPFWSCFIVCAIFVFLNSLFNLKDLILSFVFTSDHLISIGICLVQLVFSFLCIRSVAAWTWLVRENRKLSIQGATKAAVVDMEQYVRNEKKEQADQREERQMSEQRIMSGFRQNIQQFSEDQITRMGNMNTEIQKNKESIDDMNKKILGVQTEMRQSFNSLQETLKRLEKEELLPKTPEEQSSEKRLQDEIVQEQEDFEQQEYNNGETPGFDSSDNSLKSDNSDMEQVPDDEDLDFSFQERVADFESFVRPSDEEDEEEYEEPEEEEEDDESSEDDDYNDLVTGN